MVQLNDTMKEETREIVFDFYAEECEVERESINEDTNIIEDIEGDSLMFLELAEIFKKKYNLEFELKSIGEYVLKHPSETVGEIAKLILLIIVHDGNISEID